MSAGIKLKESWQQIVKIREDGEENLRMVVAEESDGEKGTVDADEKLKPNKVYGTNLGELFESHLTHDVWRKLTSIRELMYLLS